MNKFDKIMLKKHTDNLVKAKEEGNDAQIKTSLKEIEKLVKDMDKQERQEFNTQLNALNIQLDAFEQSATILSEGLSKFDDTHSDEVDKLMRETMQKQADELYRLMPEAPKHDPNGPPPNPKNPQNTSENKLTRPPNTAEIHVPTGPLSNASKNTTPHKTYRAPQPVKPQRVQPAPVKPEPVKPQKNTVEKQSQASPPPKKSNSFDQYIEKKQKELSERRKQSMGDAIKDLKKAYHAISGLIKTIVKAISKAPEQEKKLNNEDKRMIEQSAEQLAKPDITPKQAIHCAEAIINQLNNPSQSSTGAEASQETTPSEPGWLSRSLDTVKSALTSISLALGFKSAKEELQEIIHADMPQDSPNEEKNSTNQEKQEEQQNSPRSGL